jgi:DNA-binding PucR family transcriptional regulator
VPNKTNTTILQPNPVRNANTFVTLLIAHIAKYITSIKKITLVSAAPALQLNRHVENVWPLPLCRTEDAYPVPTSPRNPIVPSVPHSSIEKGNAKDVLKPWLQTNADYAQIMLSKT